MKSTLSKFLGSLIVIGAMVAGSSAEAYWTNGYYYRGDGCCCCPTYRVGYKSFGHHHYKWAHHKMYRKTCTHCNRF